MKDAVEPAGDQWDPDLQAVWNECTEYHSGVVRLTVSVQLEVIRRVSWDLAKAIESGGSRIPWVERGRCELFSPTHNSDPADRAAEIAMRSRVGDAIKTGLETIARSIDPTRPRVMSDDGGSRVMASWGCVEDRIWDHLWCPGQTVHAKRGHGVGDDELYEANEQTSLCEFMSMRTVERFTSGKLKPSTVIDVHRDATSTLAKELGRRLGRYAEVVWIDRSCLGVSPCDFGVDPGMPDRRFATSQGRRVVGEASAVASGRLGDDPERAMIRRDLEMWVGNRGVRDIADELSKDAERPLTPAKVFVRILRTSRHPDFAWVQEFRDPLAEPDARCWLSEQLGEWIVAGRVANPWSQEHLVDLAVRRIMFDGTPDKQWWQDQAGELLGDRTKGVATEKRWRNLVDKHPGLVFLLPLGDADKRVSMPPLVEQVLDQVWGALDAVATLPQPRTSESKQEQQERIESLAQGIKDMRRLGVAGCAVVILNHLGPILEGEAAKPLPATELGRLMGLSAGDLDLDQPRLDAVVSILLSLPVSDGETTLGKLLDPG